MDTLFPCALIFRPFTLWYCERKARWPLFWFNTKKWMTWGCSFTEKSRQTFLCPSVPPKAMSLLRGSSLSSAISHWPWQYQSGLAFGYAYWPQRGKLLRYLLPVCSMNVKVKNKTEQNKKNPKHKLVKTYFSACVFQEGSVIREWKPEEEKYLSWENISS